MVISDEKHFLSPLHAQEFCDKGWFIIEKALSAQILEKLEVEAKQSEDKNEQAFYLANSKQSANRVKAVFECIRQVHQQIVHENFQFLKCIHATFVIKPVGKASKMGLHQDWSVIDESRFFAFNIWSPLQDVSLNDGCLHVISGSHRTFQNIRGQNIPDVFANTAHELLPKAEAVALNQGDVLIMNQRLLHFSAENFSAQPRLVAMSTWVPEMAEVRHYRKPSVDDDKVEVYACPDDFYLYFDLKSKPKNARMLGFKVLP